MPLEKVKDWQADFMRFFRTQHADFYNKLTSEKKLETEKIDGRKRNTELDQIVADFNESWAPASAES